MRRVRPECELKESMRRKQRGKKQQIPSKKTRIFIIYGAEEAVRLLVMLVRVCLASDGIRSCVPGPGCVENDAGTAKLYAPMCSTEWPDLDDVLLLVRVIKLIAKRYLWPIRGPAIVRYRIDTNWHCSFFFVSLFFSFFLSLSLCFFSRAKTIPTLRAYFSIGHDIARAS